MEPSSQNQQPQEPVGQPPNQPDLTPPDVEPSSESQNQPTAGDYVSNPFKVYVDSFQKLFTVNFVTLLGIIGVVVLTLVVVIAAFFASGLEEVTQPGSPAIPGDTVIRIIVAVVVVLILALWAAIVEAAWEKYSIETARGNLLSFTQAMRAGFSKGLGLLGVKIITGLAILVGLILLIIPGLVLWYWFFFAKSVYVDKDVGIIASLTESKRLVKGKLVELLGLLGASFVFALPTMVPLLGFLYQIVLMAVAQISWQYRYTSADMLDREGLPKPPTHVANKVMAIIALTIVILLLVISIVPYIMMGNSS